MADDTIHFSAGDRIDTDPLGPVILPADALHGAQAERARVNFPITGLTVARLPALLIALAQVKRAAARVNGTLGLIPAAIAEAIIDAAGAVIAGEYHDALPVDVCQGGAGTSTNMAMNEVIANVALVRSGLAAGRYDVIHPNDHVNCGQSTNDAYASAVRIAVHRLNLNLAAKLDRLEAAMAHKAAEFADHDKLGRTQLQDAVPMTLGQEFGAFATTIGEDAARTREIGNWFLEINLGGTAIGTGIGADPAYRQAIVGALAEETCLDLVRAQNLVEASWDTGAFVLYAGMLKRIAAKLSKIANDLRLLSSGPFGGIGEIHLPDRQPGSSLMPGKVNPVIPEAINAIAFRVFGLDTCVTFAAEAGELQLNAFEPVIIWSLHEAADLLTHGIDMLIEHCIDGITADPVQCAANLKASTALATELVPLIGYATAARVAQAARSNGDLIAAVDHIAPAQSDFIRARIAAMVRQAAPSTSTNIGSKTGRASAQS